ncbi:MAG: helix-turn-helix domain-containing protein [Spirochaetaceae bacterium]|nr:helix-turn-helix domain-containing protein [Spirochaetaceae bacterium]
MKKVGESLKEAREKLGIDLETAAAETNISLRYLQALEADNFEAFNSETYVQLFLKNYADFLSLDTNRILALYRNHKLGEEQAPMDLLMEKPKSKLPIIILMFLAALTLVASFIFVALPQIAERNRVRAQLEEERRQNALLVTKQSFILENFIDELLSVDDEVIVSFSEDVTYRFVLMRYSSSSLLFELYRNDTLLDTFQLQLGNERFFSLNSADRANFMVSLLDIGLQNNTAARVRFERLDVAAVSSLPGEVMPVNSAVNLAINPSLGRQTILSVVSPIQVDVVITFRGYSYFRFRLDNNEQNERFFQNGDRFQRTMRNNMRLWVSDAEQASLRVGFNELSLGRAGEIVVKDLRWLFNGYTRMWELVLDNVV